MWGVFGMMCDAVSGYYYIPHAAPDKRSYCPLFTLSLVLFLLPGICSSSSHAGRRALVSVAINENVQFENVNVMGKYQASSTALWHHVIILIQTSERACSKSFQQMIYLIIAFTSQALNYYCHFEFLASEEVVASFK